MFKYLQYLPPELKELKEFKAIGAGVDPVAEATYQYAVQVYLNQFVRTSDIPTVERWEYVFRISPYPDDTLETRRLRIIARFMMRLPFTWKGLHEYIAVFSDDFQLGRDFQKQHLAVKVALKDNLKVSELMSSLRILIPADMTLLLTSVHETTGNIYVGAYARVLTIGFVSPYQIGEIETQAPLAIGIYPTAAHTVYVKAFWETNVQGELIATVGAYGRVGQTIFIQPKETYKMAKYYGILSHDGEASISNAFLTGQTIDITHIAVGDGNGAYYEPTPDMKALKKEMHRMPASTTIDPDYPNIVRINGIIPSDVGGFTVRELAAYDSKGKMVGIANYPDSPKVTLTEGVDAEMSVGFGFAVSHTEVINLGIDPTIIIATKRDIEKHNIDPAAHEDIRLELSNKANIGTPTEHDLPFTSSYTSGGADGAANSYYKSDNNLIIIAFSVCRKDGEPFTSVDTIAIIPEGYRPRNIVSASCPYGSISKTGSSAPTPIGQASVYLTMSGLVRIRTTEMDARCVFGTLIYYIH